MRPFRPYLLAIAATLPLAACSGKDPETAAGGPAPAPAAAPTPGAAPSGTPLRLGVAGPKTGPQKKNGEDLERGALLAVEEITARGGVLGRPVEMVFRDDEAQDKNATAVAGELVAAGVVGVVGHFNSGCTIPASEIYHTNGVPVITPASTNTYVTDRGYADVFRVCGRDDQQGAAAARFVVDVLKARRVAVFDNRTAYGKGLADEFVRNLEAKVEVAVREGFDEKERNFRPYLSKLKDAEVEVWYFGGIYDQAAPMLTQARQLGVSAPMMSGDGVHGYKEDFLDKVGEGANGTLTTFPDTEAAPGYKSFMERYAARFKGEPGPYAIYSYTAATLLLEAVQRAGSAEGAKVAAALHGGTFDSPLGKFEFDARGDVKANPYRVWVVKDGRHALHPGR